MPMPTRPIPLAVKTRWSRYDSSDFDQRVALVQNGLGRELCMICYHGKIGKIDFDELLPELTKNDMGHDWWTIDLCFWHDAWAVTEQCKKAVDELNKKYG